jgi:hypothetical protein
MQFRTMRGPIPDAHFDNEVPIKRSSDDYYSTEFVAANKARLRELLAARDPRRKENT